MKLIVKLIYASFTFDKCIMNGINTTSTVIYADNLHSILFDSLHICFKKYTMMNEKTICYRSIKIKNLLNNKLICYNVYKGQEAYENHCGVSYGKIFIGIYIEWTINQYNILSDIKVTKSFEKTSGSNISNSKSINQCCIPLKNKMNHQKGFIINTSSVHTSLIKHDNNTNVFDSKDEKTFANNDENKESEIFNFSHEHLELKKQKEFSMNNRWELIKYFTSYDYNENTLDQLNSNSIRSKNKKELHLKPSNYSHYFNKNLTINHFNMNKNQIMKTENVLKILKENYFQEIFAENDKNGIFNKMFYVFFDPDTAQKYGSDFLQIWRLYKHVSEGSLTCSLKFWFGLILLENFYKHHGVIEKHIKNINIINTNKICHFRGKSTKKMKKSLIRERYNIRHVNIKEFCIYYKNIYYFAIASYADSFLMRMIKKRRKFSTNTQKNAILSLLDIEECDLLMINLPNVSDVKFIVFYDVIEKSIVVSFRGTNSYMDAMNNLDCEYQMFYDGYAHRGFVKIAELFINNHLQHIKDFLKKRNTNKLLFTGQSLGAAISQIVNIIIQKNNSLIGIEVRVISFQSPPIVSKSLINSENIVNIINGYDIVSRLSFGSLLDLKYLSISAANFYNKSNTENTNHFIKNTLVFLDKNEKNAKLYLPGKILQIQNNDKLFIKEIKNEELENIIVHKKCFWDHSFISILNAFDRGIDNT